ncbi:hypothetical protein FM106_11860 [Brachybacterium faecium]|nr:hypothetical protein FM106_11860 [Brachybacterium faecium]
MHSYLPRQFLQKLSLHRNTFKNSSSNDATLRVGKISIISCFLASVKIQQHKL